jgi:hypothetical protein
MSLYIKWFPPAWFQIKMDKKIIYTDFIPEMTKHGEIDVALPPIGGRDFNMNLTEAVQATIMIKPNVAIPCIDLKLTLRNLRSKLKKNLILRLRYCKQEKSFI